ncbi:hypothetical protein P154DRAFT_540351 [Amniculicola lignicola CBS 123094]|uniref:Uncharacterized protein n=1 Tax=Amniculicola lignicola CBS 123094 TaxID=1392246 RepID=A0A6A5VX18_9PLEO|nr:hypothetical protein P154DRAFT_540351 [Amniculicola lignicola CBS 123094]
MPPPTQITNVGQMSSPSSSSPSSIFTRRSSPSISHPNSPTYRPTSTVAFELHTALSAAETLNKALIVRLGRVGQAYADLQREHIVNTANVEEMTDTFDALRKSMAGKEVEYHEHITALKFKVMKQRQQLEKSDYEIKTYRRDLQETQEARDTAEESPAIAVVARDQDSATKETLMRELANISPELDQLRTANADLKFGNQILRERVQEVGSLKDGLIAQQDIQASATQDLLNQIRALKSANEELRAICEDRGKKLREMRGWALRVEDEDDRKRAAILSLLSLSDHGLCERKRLDENIKGSVSTG